jgi:hypothetical protein
MPSIDYPGTRVVKWLFYYSSTRVIGLGTRVLKLNHHLTKFVSYFFLFFEELMFLI